ncbi:MAG: hypothetical protein VX930_18635, partial [Pseudomonadota bacterium]|nr:hypothetical protein [Pseudomonadota bacterium]
WILFALMAGGALFGFVGILLAVPVAAVLGVMLRFGLAQYLDSALYRSTPPAYRLYSGMGADALAEAGSSFLSSRIARHLTRATILSASRIQRQ